MYLKDSVLRAVKWCLAKRKLRVKKVFDQYGQSEYIPQYRRGFIWWNFTYKTWDYVDVDTHTHVFKTKREVDAFLDDVRYEENRPNLAGTEIIAVK